MFVGGFLAGVASTVLVGRTLSFLRPRLRPPSPPSAADDSDSPPRPPTIDHVVLRTENAARTRESLAFWSSNFGFGAERTAEAESYLSDPSSNAVAFPSVRVNDGTVLDLFPPELAHLGCRESPRANVVDHICLSLPGEGMLSALDKFAQNGVPVVKVVGGLKSAAAETSVAEQTDAAAAAAASASGDGKGGHGEAGNVRGGRKGAGTATSAPMAPETEIFGPWGARGRGISVYFYEPNGLYCEMRTYDAAYVERILERALLLLRDDEEECPT